MELFFLANAFTFIFAVISILLPIVFVIGLILISIWKLIFGTKQDKKEKVVEIRIIGQNGTNIDCKEKIAKIVVHEEK